MGEKFKIEFELSLDDLLDTEYTYDGDVIVNAVHSVKDVVKDKVCHILADNLFEKIDPAGDIKKRVKEMAEEEAKGMFEGVLSQKCVISDGWNKTEEYDSVRDMIREKLSAVVRGRFSGKGCSDPIMKVINEEMKRQTNNLKESIDNIIYKKERELRKLAEDLVDDRAAKSTLMQILKEKGE